MDKKIEYTIKADGTGDFTNLRVCMEYIATQINSESNIKYNTEYIVKIETGTYDIRDYYTNEEWINSSDFRGLFIPRNVKLVGLGKKPSDVVITCTNELNSIYISTLNIYDVFSAENITFSGDNVRYVIHDDYSYYPYANKYGSYRRVKNCVFKSNNVNYHVIYGSGTKGGADWLFENCIFESIQTDNANTSAFSIHDRSGSTTGITKPEKIEFRNCSFISKYLYTIRITGIDGNLSEDFILDHCNFKGIYLQSGNENSTKYNIIGAGNTRNYAIGFNNDEAKKSYPRFSDEIFESINVSGSTINYGDYVKLDSSKNFTTGTSSDYDGIAIESISNNQTGAIKLK